MSPDLDRLRLAFDSQLADGLGDPDPSFTRRRIFGQVRLSDKVTSVIGMRRAGKTTFLHQLRAEKMAGGAAPWRLPFLRLEDERFAGLDALSLGALIDEYPSRYLESADAAPEAWLLDEILRDVIDRHAVRNATGLRWLGARCSLARSPNGEMALIRVCADASDRDTASREFRALTDAGTRFPNAPKRLLTLTRSGLPSETAGGIRAQAAWEWFLGESPPLPGPAPTGWR